MQEPLLTLLLGLSSTVTWTLSGSSLQTLHKLAEAVRTFNLVMAVLLLASLYPVFMEA